MSSVYWLCLCCILATLNALLECAKLVATWPIVTVVNLQQKYFAFGHKNDRPFGPPLV